MLNLINKTSHAVTWLSEWLIVLFGKPFFQYDTVIVQCLARATS